MVTVNIRSQQDGTQVSPRRGEGEAAQAAASVMSGPPDPENGAPFEALNASIVDDLKILNGMNIDRDFNVWSEFRGSVAARNGRESFQSLISQSSLSDTDRSSRSGKMCSAPIATPVVEGVPHKKGSDHCHSLGRSMPESVLENSDHEIPQVENSLNVSFSEMSPAERRDIRAWNIRLSRDVVFSRYYFPEPWELRELKTMEQFLELQDPHENPSFLNDPGEEVTKKTITDIFYPSDHDLKQVLLRRGPMLCDGVNERELLLFTHGFLIARIELDSLLNVLFMISSENPELLSSQQLKARFDAIDSDHSGSLDRCELKEVFTGMGLPISEQALSDILERCDADGDGTIQFPEFESFFMRELTPKPKKEDRWTWGHIGEKLGERVRGATNRFKRSLSLSVSERKVECAYPLSAIEKIESINVCYSEKTEMFAKSSWADIMFAIYVKGRSDPLIMVCSNPEQRLAWVDALRTCLAKSTQLKASSGSGAAKKKCSGPGWQHRLVQATLFSLVVCNDLVALEERVENPSPDTDIDDQDEYHGYTALHYAAALGYLGCAKLLLQYGARVNLQDDDQKTALDHAALSENKEMVELLEDHGGKKQSSTLFKSAVEEQQQMKGSRSPKSSGEKAMDRACVAAGDMSQAKTALEERGERLESVEHKTATLHSDASNYATMARKLKGRTKNNAKLFGL